MTIAERCGQEEVEGSRAQEEPHPGHNRIVFQQKGRLEGSGNVAHQESQGNGQEPLAEGQVPSVEALPQEGQTQGPQILKSSNPQILKSSNYNSFIWNRFKSNDLIALLFELNNNTNNWLIHFELIQNISDYHYYNSTTIVIIDEFIWNELK